MLKDAISSSNLPTETNMKADVIRIQTGCLVGDNNYDRIVILL